MKIYDATRVNLIGMPDKLFVAYDNELVTNGLIDESKLQATVEPHNGERICIDIERWKFDIDDYVLNADSMAKYIEAINLVRKYAPDSDVGLFQGQWNQQYFLHTENWKKYSDLMAYLTPMYDSMDTIYPSFYSYFDKMDYWKAYVSTTMAMLFQYNKPFVPFVRPVYPGGSSVGQTDINGDVFHDMVKFLESLTIDKYPLAKPYFDSVAIWQKAEESRPASSAPWWVELQRFL